MIPGCIGWNSGLQFLLLSFLKGHGWFHVLADLFLVVWNTPKYWVGSSASNEASTAERAAPAASLLAYLVAFEIRFRILDKREALLADLDRCSAISFRTHSRTIWVSLSSSDAILTTHPKRPGRCAERSNE